MYTNRNVENSNNNGNGITENDAAHIRFREKQPEEEVNCLSCSRTFPVSSYMDIIQHYRDQQHSDYYKDCLYCKGKVHRYRKSKCRIEIYHDCLRWKRGMDK